MIVSPFKAWGRVTTARPGYVQILALYLIPLTLLGVAVEGYSLSKWGEKRGEFEYALKVPAQSAFRYSIAQFILLLASVSIGAKCLQWVTLSFQVQTNYLSCFTLMAYGFGPILLSRFVDALPALPSWICWGLGGVMSISVLYHGVGLALRPEQTKGFGLYVVSVIIVILFSLLSHLVAMSVLRGKL